MKMNKNKLISIWELVTHCPRIRTERCLLFEVTFHSTCVSVLCQQTRKSQIYSRTIWAAHGICLLRCGFWLHLVKSGHPPWIILHNGAWLFKLEAFCVCVCVSAAGRWELFLVQGMLVKSDIKHLPPPRAQCCVCFFLIIVLSLFLQPQHTAPHVIFCFIKVITAHCLGTTDKRKAAFHCTPSFVSIQIQILSVRPQRNMTLSPQFSSKCSIFVFWCKIHTIYNLATYFASFRDPFFRFFSQLKCTLFK